MTGADNSIRPEELVPLSEQYPFVEWAILLSRSAEGDPRYPDKAWLSDLRAVVKQHKLQLAGHIRGAWVQQLFPMEQLHALWDRVIVEKVDNSFDRWTPSIFASWNV